MGFELTPRHERESNSKLVTSSRWIDNSNGMRLVPIGKAHRIPWLSSKLRYEIDRSCDQISSTCSSFFKNELNRAGTAYPSGAPEFTPVFSVVCVARSLVFSVVFCRLLFVLLSFFDCPLCCLFFNLRILITSLCDIFKLYIRRYMYNISVL